MEMNVDTREKFALDLAKMLGLPDHVIGYELKFHSGEIPTAKCECELWFNKDRKEIKGKSVDGVYYIQRLKKKYKIWVEEIDG